MEEQANKILVELLQKASNGIDAAVSFSQAQIPDVIHQLLMWHAVSSAGIQATWSDEEFIRQMKKMLNQHKEQEKDDDSDSE